MLGPAKGCAMNESARWRMKQWMEGGQLITLMLRHGRALVSGVGCGKRHELGRQRLVTMWRAKLNPLLVGCAGNDQPHGRYVG